MSGNREQTGSSNLFGLDKRDRRLLLLLAVILGVLAIRASEVLSWAWDAQGLGYAVVTGVFNDDIPLAIVTSGGLITGWVILFMLDRTKRFQKLFIGFFAVIFIIWNIVVAEHWTANYDLGELWYVFVITLLVGIGIGILPQIPSGQRQGEYPLASAGLFVFAASLCIVGFLDLYWLGSESLNPDSSSTMFILPSTTGAVLVDATVMSVFLAAMGKFVLYADIRTVTFLGSNDAATMAILVGLFHHVEREYQGQGPNCLENGYGDLQEGRMPPADLCGEEKTEFIYLPPGLFPQWVTVSAAPILVENLNIEEFKPTTTGSSRKLTSKIGNSIKRNLLPGFFQGQFISNSRSVGTQVDKVDALVFVVTNTNNIARYIEISEQVSDETDKIVIATDGVTRTDLGEFPIEFDIIEVDWGGGNIPIITGIEEVRKHFDG